MPFARVDDSTASAPRSFENALQRLNRSPCTIDVVAHLVNVTSTATKVDLHVDEDDCGLRWVQVSIKREGVGLGLDLGHGCAAFSSGGSLSHKAEPSLWQAPARMQRFSLSSNRDGGGLVRGLIDRFRAKTTVRP